MSSCLGLYIEDNLIKYAKVSKNNDVTKVESFGVKFYDNIEKAVKQIVEETYSFKLPISINTVDEWYNEIQVFSLLTKKDMESVITTEFENICYGKDINKNIYEQRSIFTNSDKGDEKIKAIHIAVPKTSIEQRKNQFADYRVSTIVPISVAISSLIKTEPKETVMIVNIEKETTITKITNGVVSDIEVLNVGTQEILGRINKKENSYSKAYNVCKSTTIYTESDKDLQYEANEYLEDIMPTLFQIVSSVGKNIGKSLQPIKKVYITGTGAIINNIDIYFQDYLNNVRCEILKPSFINNNSKINIKDYIEVNSAIAIGLQGLEKNNKFINFKKESVISKILGTISIKKPNFGKLEIGQTFDSFINKFSRQWNLLSIVFAMTMISYFAGALFINKQLDTKIADADTSIKDTNVRIQQMQEYNRKFNSQTLKYQTFIDNINALNDVNSENKRYRNTIPNLLNNIMAVIPQGVQLISIENATDTHIVIKARSISYQEIAFFKAKLKTEKILKNVVSDTGTLKDGYLNVTIEGELP